MSGELWDCRQVDDLVARMNANEPGAAGDLFRLCERKFRGLAHRRLDAFPGLRRFYDTGDVLQETWARLLRALADVRPADGRAFERAFCGMLRRQLIDWKRSRFGPEGTAAHVGTNAGPEAGVLAVEGASGGDGPPDGPAERRDLVDCIDAATDRLPENLRSVINLLLYLEVTQVEAAGRLGKDERTVRRWYGEALRALRKECGGGEAAGRG